MVLSMSSKCVTVQFNHVRKPYNVDKVQRALLHEIAKSLKAQGRPMPEPEAPCARLFGKECNSLSQNWTSYAIVDLSEKVFSVGIA